MDCHQISEVRSANVWPSSDVLSLQAHISRRLRPLVQSLGNCPSISQKKLKSFTHVARNYLPLPMTPQCGRHSTTQVQLVSPQADQRNAPLDEVISARGAMLEISIQTLER
jgi:hypothetical protein